MGIDLALVRTNLEKIFPDVAKALCDYTLVDLETTGLDPGKCHIWQIGLMMMENCEPSKTSPEGMSLYLDLPSDILRTNQYEINRRACNACAGGIPTAQALKDAEEQYVEEVHQKGLHPGDTMREVLNILSDVYKGGGTLAGQNIVKFDLPFLEYQARVLGHPFRVPVNRIIDIGMHIKAAKINIEKGQYETPKEFYLRIGNTRAKGVYFAIERFCIPYWSLNTRFVLDRTRLHEAGYDCFITAMVIHHLLRDAYGIPLPDWIRAKFAPGVTE